MLRPGTGTSGESRKLGTRLPGRSGDPGHRDGEALGGTWIPPQGCSIPGKRSNPLGGKILERNLKPKRPSHMRRKAAPGCSRAIVVTGLLGH